MAFLEKFSESDRERIVALPYKAGLWVSMQDATGGIQSDFAEKIALHEIIETKSTQSQGMFSSAFVHEVMADLYLQRSNWKKWETDEENLFKDIDAVTRLVADTLSGEVAKDYAASVMKVAKHVAMAYREFDDEASLGESLGTKIRIAFDKVLGILTKQKYESDKLLNISVDEDKALSKLSDALNKNLPEDVAA